MGKKKNKSINNLTGGGIAPELIGMALKKGGELISSEKLQKSLFGTYSDGKTRNLIDAWHGEVLSPKQKRDRKYKKKKVKSKKIKL